MRISTYSELFGKATALIETYLCGGIQCIMILPTAQKNLDGLLVYNMIVLPRKAVTQKNSVR